MTNIERIKNMDVRSLSDFLQNECMCSHCDYSVEIRNEDEETDINCTLNDGAMDCENGCVKWLNSVYEN
jgi:hypothetical protein